MGRRQLHRNRTDPFAGFLVKPCERQSDDAKPAYNEEEGLAQSRLHAADASERYPKVALTPSNAEKVSAKPRIAVRQHLVASPPIGISTGDARCAATETIRDSSKTRASHGAASC